MTGAVEPDFGWCCAVDRRDHTAGMTGFAIDGSSVRPDRHPVVAAVGNSVGAMAAVTGVAGQVEGAVHMIGARAGVAVTVATPRICGINIELRTRGSVKVDVVSRRERGAGITGRVDLMTCSAGAAAGDIPIG